MRSVFLLCGVLLCTSLVSQRAHASFVDLGTNDASLDYAMLSRPVTSRAGSLEAELHLAFLDTPVGNSSTLGFGMGFGVSRRLELGVGTTWGLNNNRDWSETLGFRGSFNISSRKNIDIASSLLVPIHFGSGETLPGLRAGADTRIRLADNFGLFIGHSVVDLDLEGDTSLDLNLNVGIGFQVGSAGIRLDTRLFSLGLFGDNNENTSIGDVFPVIFSGLFALGRHGDLVVGVALPDVENAADVYIFTVGLQLRT